MKTIENQDVKQVKFTNGLESIETKPIFLLLGPERVVGEQWLFLYLIVGSSIQSKRLVTRENVSIFKQQIDFLNEHEYCFKCTDHEDFRLVRISSTMNDTLFSAVYHHNVNVVNPTKSFNDNHLTLLNHHLFKYLGDSFVLKHFRFPSTTIEIPIFITNDFKVID